MGIRGIEHLTGGQMQDEQKDTTPAAPVDGAPESAAPATPAHEEAQAASGQPEPDPVNEVSDDELDSLEDEGRADVSEMSPDQATQDDTVDDEENDTGGNGG